MDKLISLEAILLNVKNDVSTGKAGDIWDERSFYAEKKLCMMRRYQLSDRCCVAASTTVDDDNIEYLPSEIEAMDDFHFHLLRHTYTTNLLSHGAAPKDVQELLGHSDVSTTMNIYAHATREAKRTSARLLDKVVGTA